MHIDKLNKDKACLLMLFAAVCCLPVFANSADRFIMVDTVVDDGYLTSSLALPEISGGNLVFNLFGSNSPPLAAWLARVSEPDVPFPVPREGLTVPSLSSSGLPPSPLGA